MAKKINLQVVLFSDLDHSDCDVTFENFSYGDADYTIVTAESLRREIEEDSRFEDEEDEECSKLQGLRDELLKLGDDTLIAFQ